MNGFANLFDDDPIFPKRSAHKPKGELVVEVTRELTAGDLASLDEFGKTPVKDLTKVRHCHHQIARLVAQGQELAQISLITGYDPGYISSRLMHSPAFKELVAYYQSQVEQKFVDAVERMKVLGLSSLEELQARLAEDPDQFSRRELMELTELMLVKSQMTSQGSGPVGPNVAISVSFVQPNHDSDTKIIDLTPA